MEHKTAWERGTLTRNQVRRMDRSGKQAGFHILIWIFLALCMLEVALLTGCATPYSSNETPKASASISDTCTSASLSMGAVGEFTLIATHAKTEDGTTTGSVQIEGKKDTLNSLGTGLFGVALGWIARFAMGG